MNGNGTDGKWTVLFKAVLVVNAVAIPSILGWGWWVTDSLYRAKTDMQIQTIDRFSASMFIEVQDSLHEKNPDINWLNAAEVRRPDR